MSPRPHTGARIGRRAGAGPSRCQGDWHRALNFRRDDAGHQYGKSMHPLIGDAGKPLQQRNAGELNLPAVRLDAPRVRRLKSRERRRRSPLTGEADPPGLSCRRFRPDHPRIRDQCSHGHGRSLEPLATRVTTAAGMLRVLMSGILVAGIGVKEACVSLCRLADHPNVQSMRTSARSRRGHHFGMVESDLLRSVLMVRRTPQHGMRREGCQRQQSHQR